MGAFDPATFLADPFFMPTVSDLSGESLNWASRVIWGAHVVDATN